MSCPFATRTADGFFQAVSGTQPCSNSDSRPTVNKKMKKMVRASPFSLDRGNDVPESNLVNIPRASDISSFQSTSRKSSCGQQQKFSDGRTGQPSIGETSSLANKNSRIPSVSDLRQFPRLSNRRSKQPSHARKRVS